jgi:hypothetical protein
MNDMPGEWTRPQSRRPSLHLTGAEAVAVIRPVPRFPMDALLATVPRGDGHAVLVLPGMLRGDPHTANARAFLTDIGYATFGWNAGVNIGPTRRLLDSARDRLMELYDAHGEVSVVGFSMGGLFARWLALRAPDRVRQVVTVCSPIYEPARNFFLPLEPFLGLWPDVDLRALAREVARKLPVPGTIVRSRDDGLVNCAACEDPFVGADDNIEIDGAHVMMAQNEAVLRILAERLARPLASPVCAMPGV